MAFRKGADLRYVFTDALGSTLAVVNTSGNVVGKQYYKPYGEPYNSTGTLTTDKKYTGQRLDGSGLYFYNARYYDAALGRFVSPDSFVQAPMNPQSLNRYSYVINNPLAYTDPTGECWGKLAAGCQAIARTAKQTAQAVVDAGKAVGQAYQESAIAVAQGQLELAQGQTELGKQTASTVQAVVASDEFQFAFNAAVQPNPT